MFLQRFQRIEIDQVSAERLLLKELPRLEWAFALLLIVVAIVMGLIGLQLSSVVAFVLSILVVARANSQWWDFDQSARTLHVYRRNTLGRKQTLMTLPLHEIKGAEVHEYDNGSVQVSLILDKKEGGISNCDAYGLAWKTEIAAAINGFLAKR
ncbi:hypothetical protein MASR2M15_05700 [Anaerolineales bacterium]